MRRHYGTLRGRAWCWLRMLLVWWVSSVPIKNRSNGAVAPEPSDSTFSCTHSLWPHQILKPPKSRFMNNNTRPQLRGARRNHHTPSNNGRMHGDVHRLKQTHNTRHGRFDPHTGREHGRTCRVVSPVHADSELEGAALHGSQRLFVKVGVVHARNEAAAMRLGLCFERRGRRPRTRRARRSSALTPASTTSPCGTHSQRPDFKSVKTGARLNNTTKALAQQTL